MMKYLLFVTVLDLVTFGAIATSSHKKGLSVDANKYQCHDLDPFTGIKWWYDWSQTAGEHNNHHCSNHLRSGHIPMVWSWYSNTHLHASSSDHIILGFNEPNHDGQAHLTPQVAAQHWRQLQREAGSRVLVSPAAAPGGFMDPIQWFDEFFRYCSDCKVDYLATHAYWCNADITMNWLLKLHQRYNKKIWLTEFCCPQTTNPNDQLNYMKAILPRLENADYVDRYAWFVHRITASSGWVTSSASLLQAHSSTLTTLGQYYNNF